jgi:DNA invertase Pin-like site-specific DNA recombinase
MPLCRREEGMARRPALDDRALQFEYRFDRLLPQKLEQVYEVFMPPVRRPIGSVEFDSLQETLDEQTSCNYARVSSDRQKADHTIASQTTPLVEYAKTNGYMVPPEWVFQDEGYSGANLPRPGLEMLRDLAAQGQVATVLIYSPDRLSLKYAYQVLLAEELARCGVDIVFLKSPSGGSPEDQLVVQFQGMIAEYERAQIAERSRRGKRHKAQQGVVNILSGAPYRLHARQVAFATLCTRGFSSLVASTAALIATGWSEPVPGPVYSRCGPSPFHGAPG